MSSNATPEPFHLIYWGGIPGRGEFIRLAFEYARYPFTQSTNVPPLLANAKKSGHPTHFAPPILQLPSGDTISQTPNILHYLAPKLGLAGVKGSKILVSTEQEREESEVERAKVTQLVCTALDLTLEAHDTHHPIAVMLYYEDQLDESKRRAADFRATRISKFLNAFNTTLVANEADGGAASYLVGSQTTTADLVLFHVLCGLEHAFPKRIATLKKEGKYEKVWQLKERVEGEEPIREYLASDRRVPFGSGLFRRYPELDDE